MLSPSDYDDCLRIPGAPLAGCAIHTRPVWYSFDLAAPVDVEGPGDPEDAVRVAASDLVQAVARGDESCLCGFERGHARSCPVAKLGRALKASR